MAEVIKEAINTMEEFYKEYGKTRSIEYTYGFFDAMSVLKAMLAREKMK